MWFYSGTVGADAGQAVKNGWIMKAGIVTKSYNADTECRAFGAAVDDCEADVRCVMSEGVFQQMTRGDTGHKALCPVSRHV
eukprot:COSAG02_NODE_13004_length_1462_cov_0.950844_2_plen_81_part_00